MSNVIVLWLWLWPSGYSVVTKSEQSTTGTDSSFFQPSVEAFVCALSARPTGFSCKGHWKEANSRGRGGEGGKIGGLVFELQPHQWFIGMNTDRRTNPDNKHSGWWLCRNTHACTYEEKTHNHRCGDTCKHTSDCVPHNGTVVHVLGHIFLQPGSRRALRSQAQRCTQGRTSTGHSRQTHA